jgi:hypothetical protein
MKDFRPAATTTCFRLRNAPMGFNSAVESTLVNEVAALPIGQNDLVLGGHRPIKTGSSYRHASWMSLAVFGLLAVYATL